MYLTDETRAAFIEVGRPKCSERLKFIAKSTGTELPNS
jgi:hypothetical protein